MTSSSLLLHIRNSRFKASAYSPLSPQVVPTNSGTSHSVNADSGGSNTGQVAGERGTDLLAHDVNDIARQRLSRAIITRRGSVEALKPVFTFIA
ncbi:Uncharacterised protein [Yersinia frederiksenii]|nr:Uncharacterised protein [Yersinia frederiksenii]